MSPTTLRTTQTYDLRLGKCNSRLISDVPRTGRRVCFWGTWETQVPEGPRPGSEVTSPLPAAAPPPCFCSEPCNDRRPRLPKRMILNTGTTPIF